MKAQSIDTNTNTEKVLISLIRKKDVSEKLRQVRSLSQVAMQLSKRAIARANRNLGEDQISLLFIKLHYGKELAEHVEKYIKKEPYHQYAMSRKTRDTFVDDDTSTEFYFSSPEDIIINKLQWYEMGGRVSERQWLDVLGVIKVQGDSLDKDYLLRWSEKLGILELLKSCFGDSDV